MVSGTDIGMVFAKRHLRLGVSHVFSIKTVPNRMAWLTQNAGSISLHIMVSKVFLRDCWLCARLEDYENSKYKRNCNPTLTNTRRELLEIVTCDIQNRTMHYAASCVEVALKTVHGCSETCDSCPFLELLSISCDFVSTASL
jgi:hypothetical protein